MKELLAPEDLPIHVPGTILVKSDGLGWSGVSLRSYAYRGQDVVVPAMRDFMLVSYQAGVTPMRRRFDGRWSRATCGPGAVSLLTRSQSSHWRWTEDVEVTHVYLSSGFVSDVAREVSGKEVSEVELADVLRADDEVMTSSVAAIAAEASDPGVGGDLYVDAVARQLVIHLLRRYADLSFTEVAGEGGLSPAQRERAREYVEAELHRRLTLKEIAQELNMAVCTFSRHFQRSFGAAPYAYVVERRLDRARRLLTETRLPIKEIAASCGFADQAHLTRRFSKRYAASPSRYRKGARAAG